MTELRFTISGINALQPTLSRDGSYKEARLLDDRIRGLGVRVRRPDGKKRFFIRFVLNSKRGLYEFGTFGRMTVEQARREAQRLYGQIAAGVDPRQDKKTSQDKLTVGALCAEYLARANEGTLLFRGKPKSSSTLEIDAGRISTHILPLIGDRLVTDLSRKDVISFHSDVVVGKAARCGPSGKLRGKSVVTGGAGTAARTIGLLGSIFNYAVDEGYISSSPVHRIQTRKDARRIVNLPPEAYSKLGEVLRNSEAAGENPLVIAQIRFVALTGLRASEVKRLTFDMLDPSLGAITYQNSKTGPQRRPVGEAAFRLLPKQGGRRGSEYVFSGSSAGTFLTNGSSRCGDLSSAAGLERLTFHKLRHGFAQVANSLGYAELTIKGLLGHSAGTVTAGYVYVDPALKQAADRVSEKIESCLDAQPMV